MRKGSAHLVIILGVALAIIGGLIYYALTGSAKKAAVQSPTPSSSATVSPTPVAKNRTVTSEEILLDVPKDWTEEITEPAENVRIYRYSDVPSGYFVDVRVFTGGGDRAADAFWRYRLTDDGKSFTLIEEEPDCNPQGMCQKGDGALSIGIALVGLPGEMIKGRFYEITFGNTKSETADRQLFRDIMKTARLK